MAKRSLGLTSLKLGDIASDGGMGTSLSAIGDTVNDTAVLSNDENQTQDFFTEEADDPIESIVTQKGAFNLAWSSYNLDPDVMVKVFGGTKTAAATGVIDTLGAITGGTSYTNGTYTDVALTGGTGTGATADITVSGGSVTAVTLKEGGSGYAVANSLSASAASIGGTGSGFSIPVATITAHGGKWASPSTIDLKYQSIEIIDKKGNKIQIVRGQVSAQLEWNLKKTALAQVNISVKVLVPTKANTPPYTITYAV